MLYRNEIGCLSEMMTDKQFKQQLEYIIRILIRLLMSRRA